MVDARPTRTCCGTSPTVPMEDALRTIFVLSGRGEAVTTSMLADVLGVRPPTVSSMLKRLAEHGLLDRDDHHARLTEHGARHARHVIRRHRLVETLLVDVLGVPADQVHEEADELEHAVSDRLLDHIDALLGHPRRDPHGDPIPRDGDDHEEGWGLRLDAAAPASRFAVERVHDWDVEALRHLTALGIRPGATLDVVERGPFDGPLWVRVDGHDHALSHRLTSLVHGTRPVTTADRTSADTGRS